MESKSVNALLRILQDKNFQLLANLVGGLQERELQHRQRHIRMMGKEITKLLKLTTEIKEINQRLQRLNDAIASLGYRVKRLEQGVGLDIESVELLSAGISALNLECRASNCLKAANIKTIGELISYTDNELFQVRNLGKTTLKEIKKKLQLKGLFLKSHSPENVEA